MLKAFVIDAAQKDTLFNCRANVLSDKLLSHAAAAAGIYNASTYARNTERGSQVSVCCTLRNRIQEAAKRQKIGPKMSKFNNVAALNNARFQRYTV